MTQPQRPRPPAVLAELRRYRATGGHGLPDHLTLAGLRPLPGGRNNTVYAWTPAPGQGTKIIKPYKDGERGRGEREWAALVALHAARPGDAPAPLWADLDHPRPAIGMSRLPGVPLPELDTGRYGTALPALAALHRRIHHMPIPGALAKVPRAGSWAHPAAHRRVADRTRRRR